MKFLVKFMLASFLMASFSTALLADKDWDPCGDKKANTPTMELLIAL
ncbi:MAG: hypothetical protein ABFQ64_11060 [Campylobacterota bacterium]